MKRLLAVNLIVAMILPLTLLTTVSAEMQKRIYLNTTNIELSEGASATIKAVGTSGGEISFSSFDDTVAEVDSEGVITAINEGEVIIEASDGSNTAQCIVNVKSRVEGAIRISERYIIGKSGDCFQLSAEAPEGVDVSELVWSSSNSNRVSVDQSGFVTVLTAQMSETVYITATLGDYSDTCCVYVVSANDSRKTVGTNKHFTYVDNNSSGLFQYMYYEDGEYHYYDSISGSGVKLHTQKFGVGF